VVLAAPAFVAADLLDTFVPDVAAEMARLDYASVAMVTLAIEKRSLDHPLDGSGFLVAMTSALPTLTACSWASTKWAHLQNDDVAILRVSAGKFGDDHALALTDDELLSALHTDLERTIGLHGSFRESRITRWRNGLPQFTPGHLGRVEGWRQQLAVEVPNLFVAGAAYDGLGLPACLRQGSNAAASLRRQSL
jgi:oxygen-dependent protoporphyrinogen oxidase